MKATLLTDIISHLGKPKTTYGTAKETVIVIEERGNVMIVEGKGGRYSVPSKKLQVWENKKQV